MRRLLVFLAIVCTAAVGAWALPAGQASPTIDPAGADAAPAEAPVVTEPRLAEPAVSVAPSAVDAAPLEVHEVLPAVGEAVSADHLTPVAQDDHAPEAIVTTTTAPPASPSPSTPPPTDSAAPAPVAFTATQAYGSCGEDVPYDIFSGTASPGSTVAISSPYGSGSATAGGDGHWERRVEFPSAPRGETFAVSVSGGGGSATLHFTATGAAHA